MCKGDGLFGGVDGGGGGGFVWAAGVDWMFDWWKMTVTEIDMCLG